MLLAEGNGEYNSERPRLKRVFTQPGVMSGLAETAELSSALPVISGLAEKPGCRLLFLSKADMNGAPRTATLPN